MNSNAEENDVDAVVDRVGIWFEQFSKSLAFDQLTAEQKSWAGNVVENFTQYAFDYCGQPPEGWTRSGVRECCLDVMPRKVSAEPESSRVARGRRVQISSLT